jgi:brefeldin A-resistance guanine nucleotide exchange factor 1
MTRPPGEQNAEEDPGVEIASSLNAFGVWKEGDDGKEETPANPEKDHSATSPRVGWLPSPVRVETCLKQDVSESSGNAGNISKGSASTGQAASPPGHAERKDTATKPKIFRDKSTTSLGTSAFETCLENGVRIVKGEIHNVLSIMRLNRRYNSSTRFLREIPAAAESPLVRGLKALHESLAAYTDLKDFDTMVWLRPFLDVIESAETSGPITGVALSSLSKFLLYGFIHPNSPRVAEAVNTIAHVVTRCRFERTDHSGDEVVLMRILQVRCSSIMACDDVCFQVPHLIFVVWSFFFFQVLLDCLRSPAGTLLTDQNVWDMVQSCYDIGRQPRLSELLQRTAEHILMQLTLTIYARFSELQAEGSLSADINSCTPLKTAMSHDGPDASQDGAGLDDTEDEGCKEELACTPPYGMPCMYKVLEFFCQLTNLGENPTDPSGETRRMLGLALVNVVLETGGRQLSTCPALVSVIQHDLSRNLLQNSRTTNLQILSPTLRVVFNMFNSVREHMKVQLEVFFNSIHLAESQVYEIREMALESLVEFCREPQLMVELYTNYDCDVHCTNLFEDMCKFLSKNTFPLSGSLNALNLLSLEGLLAIVGSLCESCQPSSTTVNVDAELAEMAKAGSSVEQLREQKQHKKRLALGAEQFNRSHKKGIEFLQSIGLLPEVFDAKSIATFFRSAPGLDRTEVGTYLGEPGEANLQVLAAYSESFDFAGLGLADALKRFLAGFRLPGEAQKIARIVEAFAGHYYLQCPGPLANADTAYVLSYAVIMLNTDLHNPQVKKKMTKEDFVRMNRGLNNGEDLPFEFLSDLYENILHDEIKMRGEIADAATIEGDDKRWSELLRGRGGKLAFTGVESVHCRDMFLVVWDRIISALSVVFETTEDEKVLKKTLEGLHKFASICAYHRLYEEFNKVVSSISKSLYKFASTTDTTAIEEEALWVFVRHPKVQQAARAMMSMSIEHANCLREGWRTVLDYITHLHRLSALPAPIIERDDFVDLQGRPLGSSSSAHQHQQVQHEAAQSSGGGGRGLLSFLFGSQPAGVRTAGKSIGAWTRLGTPGNEALTEFVATLKLEDLFGNTKFLSPESLLHLVQALVFASSRYAYVHVHAYVHTSNIDCHNCM